MVDHIQDNSRMAANPRDNHPGNNPMADHISSSARSNKGSSRPLAARTCRTPSSVQRLDNNPTGFRAQTDIAMR
jgi:hypothetical protein